MKKLCMLLCCITLLAGCVSREQAISDKAGGKPQKQSASNEALQLKRWSFRSLNQGDGNEQGFYRIKPSITVEGTCIPISYIPIMRIRKKSFYVISRSAGTMTLPAPHIMQVWI